MTCSSTNLFPGFFPKAQNLLSSSRSPGQRGIHSHHAFRNATLQGAYLIIAGAGLALDVGPMSGFDNGKVDAEFFPTGATSPIS